MARPVGDDTSVKLRPRPLNSNQHRTRGEMNAVSSFCASRGRDAQNERDGARAAQLRCSSDSVRQQEQLRRSSTTIYRQPRTHMVVSSSRPSSRCCCCAAAGSVLRRDASCCGGAAQHQLRRSTSKAAEQLHQLRCSTAAATAGDSSGLPTMSGRGTRGFFLKNFI